MKTLSGMIGLTVCLGMPWLSAESPPTPPAQDCGVSHSSPCDHKTPSASTRLCLQGSYPVCAAQTDKEACEADTDFYVIIGGFPREIVWNDFYSDSQGVKCWAGHSNVVEVSSNCYQTARCEWKAGETPPCRVRQGSQGLWNTAPWPTPQACPISTQGSGGLRISVPLRQGRAQEAIRSLLSRLGLSAR